LTLCLEFPKFKLVRLFTIVVGALVLLCASRAASPELVNGIAVVVGDAVITYKDVQMAIEDDLDILQRRYGNQPAVFNKRAAEVRESKLEEMVENQLVLQEFKRAGYLLPDSWIQSRINQDVRQYGDRLTLTKTLQARGITFESYRTRIRENEILRQMWQMKVPRDPLISPTKIENYYTQHRDDFKLEDQAKLRIIALTNAPNVALKAMANEIVRKLDEKVPFEELAKIYSQDSKAAEGGERGWMEKKEMREDFRKVAFELSPGEHSQPIETPEGIYIIQVMDKKVSYTKSLSEVRDEIENTLRALETKRLRQQWIEQLKTKSFVQYY
jgi:peptidyl-prolyl cis-trans isomerase SurA